LGTAYGTQQTFTTTASAVFLPSVTIGTQVWATQNLSVERYRNGDVIPQVTNATQWAALTTGAWCWYDNSEANGSIYGKLYNWYAVNDPRGLAPQGWHIPTDAEWTILGAYLGGDAVAGGKMKTTGNTIWRSPNESATNESGYAGLPGGYRNVSGTFNDVGNYGGWWSATEYNSTVAWYRYLYYTNGNLDRGSTNKNNGFSVRCLLTLSIGDYYQGGKVFYILVSGDPGYDANVQHGLIAATSDQGIVIPWFYGYYPPTTGATGLAIGTGSSNTTAIITSQSYSGGSWAAKLCRDFRGGGYTDWYLPSKDEIYKLYLNRKLVGGFALNLYWSSTEYDLINAWIQDFNDDKGGAGWCCGNVLGQSKLYKTNPRYVRAIRAF
jgi:uncharacterized protein (TIGR02145 family)